VRTISRSSSSRWLAAFLAAGACLGLGASSLNWSDHSAKTAGHRAMITPCAPSLAVRIFEAAGSSATAAGLLALLLFWGMRRQGVTAACISHQPAAGSGFAASVDLRRQAWLRHYRRGGRLGP